LGPWTGADDVAPAQQPPFGLSPAQAPLLFGIGFDDNGDAQGMTWALNILRARGVHASFFMTAAYARDEAIAETWRRAARDGHEIGNHSDSHLPLHGGRLYAVQRWSAEIHICTTFLVDAGIVARKDLRGFRTPFLEYNDATLTAVAAAGLHYDCSIEEGAEPGQDGSNAYWPYTLDRRSPGHSAQVRAQTAQDCASALREIEPHPGLWELAVPAVFVPPDARCADYEVAPGLRDRLKTRQPWFDAAAGAITGFDFNLWADPATGGFAMTAAEFLATLKYTVDQRLAGNRAPLLFGSHTGCYVDAWDENAPHARRAADRRATVEALLDYVASKKDARIARRCDVLDWVRNPTPL
jgi:peptidoglycan/xylan/chitin deacetylase (PgdA/CDA1 family)